MKKYLPYISIIAAMLIWSLSGPLIKIALRSFTPLTIIVIRFTIAIVLMFAVGMLCRNNALLGLQRVEKKDLLFFIGGGFFQPFLYYILETYTYQQLSSPTVAEALLSTSPLLAPVFAAIFLREKVTWNNIVGILISSAGMLLLVLAGSESFDIGNPIGILLAFLSVSTAIMYSVMVKRIPVRYNALTVVFYTQGIALLLFYPMWAIFDLPSMTWNFGEEVGVSFLSILYLSVFSSVTAFILFCYTLRQLGLTRTNVFNNVRPIFTAILMMLLFSEHLPWMKWVGIGIIIIGLFICQKQRKT